MNIQQLRYFLVLADTLSFTKTAEKYYISQTAISNQIKALEEKLGVQAFSGMVVCLPSCMVSLQYSTPELAFPACSYRHYRKDFHRKKEIPVFCRTIHPRSMGTGRHGL